MTRRRLRWAVAAALLLLAIAGLWRAYGTQQVTFTEAEVQERINKQLGQEFPVKGAAHLLVKSIKVRAATVHIQDNRVIARVDVEGSLRTNKSFTLTANAVGIPTYSFGELFFKPDQVEVQKFAYEGGTPTQLFTGFAKRYVSDDKARQLVEDTAPAVESWMTAVAQYAAVYTLERRPVYRLKDGVKGFLIKASLASVTIDQDRIVVTFSIWQLTASVMLGALCLLGGIIVMWWILIPDSLLSLALIALLARTGGR
jgi:uncharacterized membrane protein